MPIYYHERTTEEKSLNRLEITLRELGYSKTGKAQYDNIDCIVISKEEKRFLSSLEVELYVIPEGDKIKVIGGDWIGYGSWEDFSDGELLEYETTLNKQKSELIQQKEDSNLSEINIQTKLAEELMNNHHGVNTEDPESIFVACSDKKISSIGIRHIEFEIKLDNDGKTFELLPIYSALQEGIDVNLKNQLEQKAVSIFSEKINLMLEEIHDRNKEYTKSEIISEKKGIKATLEILKNLKSKKNNETSSKRKDLER